MNHAWVKQNNMCKCSTRPYGCKLERKTCVHISGCLNLCECPFTKYSPTEFLREERGKIQTWKMSEVYPGGIFHFQILPESS